MRLFAALEFGRPDEDENGAGAQEQRVRAVIDVLPPEVPDMDFGEVPPVATSLVEGLDDNAVRGWKCIVVTQASEAATELRLSDAAVAENHQFHVARFDAAVDEVRKMRTKPG